MSWLQIRRWRKQTVKFHSASDIWYNGLSMNIKTAAVAEHSTIFAQSTNAIYSYLYVNVRTFIRAVYYLTSRPDEWQWRLIVLSGNVSVINTDCSSIACVCSSKVRLGRRTRSRRSMSARATNCGLHRWSRTGGRVQGCQTSEVKKICLPILYAGIFNRAWRNDENFAWKHRESQGIEFSPSL